MKFYVGLSEITHTNKFDRVLLSTNRLKRRKSEFYRYWPFKWIQDPGSFHQLKEHGKFDTTPEEYVENCDRFRNCGMREAIVAQDWLCTPLILQKTGLTVQKHQQMTVDLYDAINKLASYWQLSEVMPVLQGLHLEDVV